MRASPDPELEALDAALAARPDHAELHYCRAARLMQTGRLEEAKQGFLAALSLAPAHFGALNDLGTLLHRTDFRAAARTAYAEAVKHHPDKAIGRINLGNALLANGEIEAARAEFETAIRLEPDHPDAHQGLANLLQHIGEADAAEEQRRLSYRGRAPSTAPYRGEGPPCRVLLLMSAVGGNVPTRFVLDDRVFQTTTLVVEAFTPDTELPEHDVVFNVVGDADLCPAALDDAERVLARTTAPVINPPGRVRPTGRAENARRLAELPGVVAPRVALAPRDEIAARAAAFGYPLLLRSPGYHTGQHFKRVEAAADLHAAAADLPGQELLMIQYLDARDDAGCARKYRVMMIGGALLPLHLAISADWKVHYFTADMADRPEHRAEEKAFLHDMPAFLGPRAMAALAHIQDALALDYAGVDFGLARNGDLLLFEANATMVVNPPPPEPIWDYRRAAVERILSAAQGMTLARSRQARR
jgi:Tfp pilus assembly protein PilF